MSTHGYRREKIFALYGVRCAYCGTEKEPKFLLTLDHVIPKGLGGRVCNHRNLVPACMRCNAEKGDAMDGEARMQAWALEIYLSLKDEEQHKREKAAAKIRQRHVARTRLVDRFPPELLAMADAAGRINERR